MNFEDSSRLITSQYLKDLQDARVNSRYIDSMTPEKDYSLVNKSEAIQDVSIKHPLEFLDFPMHDPPLLPLRQLRQIVPTKRPSTVEKLDSKTGSKTFVSTSDRFQPNDPSTLIARIPSHNGNSWCEQSITCNDQLRYRAPFCFYGQRLDRLTKSQADQLENWQMVVRKQCNKQRAAIENQLELCHSYNTLLHHMRPDCWQTGLTDMGQSYAYRYKNMMKTLLGHGHHDRNSARETLIRYTIPFKLMDFEHMTPLEYLQQFCVIRDTRLPFYLRIFNKYKDNRTQLMLHDKLFLPLNALMSGSFKEEQVDELVSLLGLAENQYDLNAEEFACACGLAERLYYCKNMRIFGEEGFAMQQGILEMADFHMFIKKMDNVKLTKSLQTFLQRMDLFK